jgi:hypothetical protein
MTGFLSQQTGNFTVLLGDVLFRGKLPELREGQGNSDRDVPLATDAAQLLAPFFLASGKEFWVLGNKGSSISLCLLSWLLHRKNVSTSWFKENLPSISMESKKKKALNSVKNRLAQRFC